MPVPGTRGAAADWRLVDTGAMSAAANIALDAAMLALSAQGRIPPTIRFLQFSPGAALVGRHQSVEAEIREDFCSQNGIQVNRRLTGGGAVFFDSTQIGWEVIAPRTSLGAGPRLEDLTEYICRGVVRGLALMGVSAGFRPRNDIEADGRKLCGTGGAYEGGSFLFQGTLLVDFDAETMIRSLKVPTEKLSVRELDSARQRVTCLSDLLPELPGPERIKAALAEGFRLEFGIELDRGDLGEDELEAMKQLLPRYESGGWIHEISEPPGDHHTLSGIHKAEGGLVRSSVSLDLRRRRIKSVIFTGDFFMDPARAVFDLETSLKDAPLEEAGQRVIDFFDREGAHAMRMDPRDFWRSLQMALNKLELCRHGISLPDANRTSLVGSGGDYGAVLAEASVLLLPYCAKLPDCDRRDREGCDHCGDCSVGAAYELADAKRLAVLTVQDFDHLRAIFAACRRAGVRSFIGCCCRAFLVRRHRAFAESGMSGLLVDIESETCYDLSRERDAYAGRFANQTHLRLALLRQIMELVPARDAALEISVSDTAAGGQTA